MQARMSLKFGALDRALALSLIAGFTAACGDDAPKLESCNPSPEPLVGLPSITSIEPTSGPAGTTVTVRGTGFDAIDDRYEAAYGDFSLTCQHGTLEGTVVSDTEIEVVISEQANLPGFIYLVADGLTVARSPQRFELEGKAFVTVHNRAQFPIVSVTASWDSVLEAGDRIDVEASHTLEVPTGPVRLEMCVGDRDSAGEVEQWACVVHDDRLTAGETVDVTVPPIPAAQFLVGEWVATWEVGEEEVASEQLRIDGDGYWELRYEGRVVESGEFIEPDAWTPYARDFRFALRDEDPPSETSVPVRSFVLLSERAGDRVTFYRPE